MSKKLSKIKKNTVNTDGKFTTVNFSSVQSDFCIVDIAEQGIQNVLNHATLWIAQAPKTKTLHYICLMSEVDVSIDNCPIGQELLSKFPPLLPGMHLVELADSRVQLILGFGEPQSLLSTLLWHPNAILEKQLRFWSVDHWILPCIISDDMRLLIAQFSNQQTQALATKFNVQVMPWAMPKYQPEVSAKNIIIIGAGLAGCYLAHVMAKGGWRVTVLEANAKPALNGSGNHFSVLYPKLSLHDAPFTELLHSCYPYAFHCWQSLLEQYPELGRTLPLWQEGDAFHQELLEFLSDSPDWFASEKQHGEGLLFHKSLIIDMPAVCERLLQHENILCLYNHHIDSINFHSGLWYAGAVSAPVCVLANSYQSVNFSQSSYLGTKGMRGQMTHTPAVHPDKKVFCQQGHFLPEWRGVHAVGASFVPNDLSLEANACDDEKNLAPWRQFFNQELEACGSWVGVRGVSLDHLPIVGPLCDKDAFVEQFGIWRHHANRVVDDLMPNLPGLFAFTGFGARGLITIPRLARYLQASIEGKPLWFPTALVQALSPARFLRKKIVKNDGLV